MEFTYPYFKRQEFISAISEIRDELKLSTFGLIDFNIDPNNEMFEIATVSTDFANKLSFQEISILRAIK